MTEEKGTQKQKIEEKKGEARQKKQNFRQCRASKQGRNFDDQPGVNLN